jgi:hypothetical protein
VQQLRWFLQFLLHLLTGAAVWYSLPAPALPDQLAARHCLLLGPAVLLWALHAAVQLQVLVLQVLVLAQVLLLQVLQLQAAGAWQQSALQPTHAAPGHVRCHRRRGQTQAAYASHQTCLLGWIAWLLAGCCWSLYLTALLVLASKASCCWQPGSPFHHRCCWSTVLVSCLHHL